MNKQAANMLGLCQRAGKLLSGDCAVKDGIKNKKVVLVLLATDASERTKKEYLHIAKANNTNIVQYGTKADLGRSVGKSLRAAVAITDSNFAKEIIQIIERGET